MEVKAKTNRKYIPAAESIGKKYGRLEVLRIVGRKRTDVLVEAVCECGTVREYVLSRLRSGNTKSCGCLGTIHGLCMEFGHEFCDNHRHMVGRMNGVYSHLHHHKEWEAIAVFGDYVRASGGLGWERGKQLDRIDGAKGYIPGNVRYIFPWENHRNKKSNHLLTFRGITLTLTDFAEALDLDAQTVIHRINGYGWTTDRALTTSTPKPFRLSNGLFDAEIDFLNSVDDPMVEKLRDRKNYMKAKYLEFATQRRWDYQHSEGIFAGMTPLPINH